MSRTGWLVQQAVREPLIPLEGECCIRKHSLSCVGSDYQKKWRQLPIARHQLFTMLIMLSDPVLQLEVNRFPQLFQGR